ncbi:MAG: hypothetical protein M0Z83_06715 [Betaproteobacteria bacterium]|nr:hypothetical protein [Betaproteobacteria bacterium]
MSTTQFSSSRRQLLGAIPALGLLTATGFVHSAHASDLQKNTTTDGPVTFYAEMRVAQPNKAGFDTGMQAFAKAMQRKGALAVTLKQMVGDSTMVKNYPASYKGVLRSAYADGAQSGTLPLFYSLFVRFPDLQTLRAANADAVFDLDVLPHLHGVTQQDGKMRESQQPMVVYRGIFETILAGDRHGIYNDRNALLGFLSQPVDNQAPTLVTVENHVFVPEHLVTNFDQTIPALLKVAQETYQPASDANLIGQPGAVDNLHYRKAMSTEILRCITTDGDLRAYIMHGIWESVWDHENSHLDTRFKAAAAPVGAMVAVGPVEPFYLTQLTLLKG